MDPWELFSRLCKLVVEEQNVYLVVTVIPGIAKIALLPLEKFDDGEDYEDET